MGNINFGSIIYQIVRKDNDSIYFHRLLEGFNDVVYVMYLVRCLASDTCEINVSYHLVLMGRIDHYTLPN